MYIIKLGGSVITDKTKENCYKKEIVDNLVKEIKKANKKTIIVHGAGSFGHIIADKYNLNEGHRSSDQLLGFSLTQGMVQKFHADHLRRRIHQGGYSQPVHRRMDRRPFFGRHLRSRPGRRGV